MFQLFQLTTLVINGPAARGENFIVRFDRVAIRNEKARGVLLCVQYFVRSMHITQRSFFLESGLTMLSESVAIADSITSSPIYAPWSIEETAYASQVITDLRACWDRILWRRPTAKDTSERWYHVGTPRSETASRPRVRFTDVVDEGLVEYVPVALPALGPPGPGKVSSSPSRRKRKISRNPMKMPQKIEISSPPASPQRQSLVDDPSFASTLAAQNSRRKSPRSGRDRRAAPVFQMGFPFRRNALVYYSLCSPFFSSLNFLVY